MLGLCDGNITGKGGRKEMKVFEDDGFNSNYPECYTWEQIDSNIYSNLGITISNLIFSELAITDKNLVAGLRESLNIIADKAEV